MTSPLVKPGVGIEDLVEVGDLELVPADGDRLFPEEPTAPLVPHPSPGTSMGSWPPPSPSSTSTWTPSTRPSEIIRDPSLKGKPVIVGGQAGPRRRDLGELRGSGLRGAIGDADDHRPAPLSGRRLSVQRLQLLRELSIKIRDIFTSYSPLVEPLSLDEAFIDVGGSVKLFGSPVEIARRIKTDVAGVRSAVHGGSGSQQVPGQARIDAGQAQRAARGQGGLGPTVPSSPADRGSLGSGGRDLARRCGGLGLKTVGDVAAMPRQDPRSVRSGTRWEPIFTSWPTGWTIAR